MIPNFDDVDLGIITIGAVLLLVGSVLAFKGQMVEGLGFMGGGITAIAALAGKSKKQNGGGTDNAPE